MTTKAAATTTATTARRTRTAQAAAPAAAPGVATQDTPPTVPAGPAAAPTRTAAKPARRTETTIPAEPAPDLVATAPTEPAAAPAATATPPARRKRTARAAATVDAPPAPVATPFTTTGQRDQFKEALAVLGHVIPAKPTLPILAHVLLRSDGQRLTLHASDTNMTIAWTLPWTASGAGAVTLPAKLLTDLVAVLPSGALELRCDGAAETTVLRSAGSEATLKGWDVEDFPVPPVIDSTTPTFQLDAATLREAIEQVVFAASTEEARPVLTGVLFALSNDQLRLSASDGFRLAVKTIDLDTAVETPQRLVIPATALAELGKVLQAETEVVRFTVAPSGGQLLIETARAALHCRLLHDSFPDLQRVIPQQVVCRVVVARDDLRLAVRQAAVFAAASAHVTRLTIEHAGDARTPQPAGATAGRLELSARAAELGDTAATLPAQLTGAATQVGLNSRFLKEALGVLPTPEITLELEGGVRPVVFRPVGDPSLLIVVMPMALTD